MFRWESCKGSVWESMKKCFKLCSEVGTRGWISWVARGLQATRRCTRVKHAEKLNRHASCSTTGKKVQTGHSVSLWLGLATQSSREAKLPVYSVMEKMTLRILFSLQYKYPLIPTKSWELPKRILREKPWIKTILTHPQFLHSDPSYSSTLTLSIVTSLRGSLTRSFSHLTHISEKAFWCFGKQFRRDQFTLVDVMSYSEIQ